MLKKRSVMAFKQEVTPGTAVALTGTEGAINCFNLGFPKQQYNMQEREQQGGFFRMPAVSGARLMTIDFETEAVGTGAVGDVNTILSALIQCCGYTVAGGVFTPTDDPSAMTCVTAGYYLDGKLRILSGCAGTFTLIAKNGQKAMFKFTLTGKPAPDTDTALIVPTFPTVIPPRGLASLSVNSITTLRAAQFMFDSGSVPHALETLINDTNSTGYAFCLISDRMSKGTLDPEATTVATADWETLLTAPTEFALSAVIGSATHNTITIAAVGSKAQLMEREYGDRGGVANENLNLNFNRGATLTFA